MSEITPTAESKFTMYVDNESDSHVNFRVFVNGAFAGKLCMRVDEFADFCRTFAAKRNVS